MVEQRCPGIVVQDVAGRAGAGPGVEFRCEVEVFDDCGTFVDAPLVSREHPHDFELVAVGVDAVDAFGGTVARLAGVGTRIEQGPAKLDELVDGVELPGQVVETDRPAWLGDGPGDAEQPEVVVVSGAGQPQEGAVELRFARDEFHAEHLGVEAHRAVEVGDEEHRVVETDGRDGH